MQMGLMICDYYRMKVERLPPHLQYAGFYVRAGDKPLGICFDDYELTGRTWHPDRRVIADIERDGISRRELHSGINAAVLWPHLPPSRQSQIEGSAA
jgi:hypothetical protein